MCAVECLCAHSSLPMQVLTLHHTRPKSPALAVPPRPLPGVRPLQLCTRRDCAAAHHSRADRPGRPSVHTQRGKPAVAKAPRGPERLGRQPQQAGCPYFTIHLHISCLPYSLAVFVLSRMAPQSLPSGSHALPTALPPPCTLQVRVGVSIHHSVQSVALDTLVEHRLGGEGGKVRFSGYQEWGLGKANKAPPGQRVRPGAPAWQRGRLGKGVQEQLAAAYLS